MYQSRLSHRSAVLAAGGLWLLALSDAANVAAYAQAKLEARYVASLAGIPLGKGAWVIDLGEDRYTAAASGMTTGLVRVFTSAHGTGASRGAIVAQQFVPASYAASISGNSKIEEVRMTLSGGDVKDFAITPPPPPDPDRIPISDAHRRGVTDPMTASLVRVPGNGGNVLSPSLCQRHLSVFDGRMRYDLDFAFKRFDKVKAERGYDGPVIVCAVYFYPIAGHVPDRAAIKYLVKLRDMEVWLAPVGGTRVVVPFRFSIPTPLGLGVLEATQFVAIAQPSRASVKTQ